MAHEVADGAGRCGLVGATGAAQRCQGLADDDPTVLLAAVATYRHVQPTVELPLACTEAALRALGVRRRRVGRASRPPGGLGKLDRE